MTTLDSKQMELILAMIKHIGAPSGKEAWQEIADKLTDKPPAETCRSRWRGIEAKMKNGLAANGGDTGSQISVKKPKSTPRKKSAAKGSGKPTVKKPQGKKVMVAKDEDHDEGGDDDNLVFLPLP